MINVRINDCIDLGFRPFNVILTINSEHDARDLYKALSSLHTDPDTVPKDEKGNHKPFPYEVFKTYLLGRGIKVN